MGHLHAEPLHCFLPAVYFSIYSSNVLLRQCPTLSGRFFSHFMAFCSHNTSDIRGLFETFWSTTSVYVQGTHAVSGLIKMSFDCGVRESWQRCQLGKSLFSCLKMSHLTIAPNIILHIPVTHIHICKANTSGVRESILVRQWSMTSLLWRVCILSVCLCLSLIRFLFGCQSQSPLDPLRQYRLIPKWPSTTDHQPLSTTAARQAAKKRMLDFQKPEVTPPSLHYDSPPAPDSMQYSRQFEPGLIYHSNSHCVTVYTCVLVCLCMSRSVLACIGMVRLRVSVCAPECAACHLCPNAPAASN